MMKMAFLFPGQGSQYVGMGKSLCQSFPEAGNTFDEANEALGFDLKRLCFEGGMEELTKTENTQPAVLTASIAAYRIYRKEIGVEPVLMAGHSLGEISALCCAGGINFSDAVKIVNQRGRFMQDAVAPGNGMMAAVSGLAESVIEEECRKASQNGRLAVVSNYNSPDQIVISGHTPAVEEVSESLNNKGARVVPLRVSAPFHSPLMQPAALRLRVELEKYNFGELIYSVISNVTAAPYPGKDSIIEYLTRQIVQPVHWQASIEHMLKEGVDFVVELGPQAVLCNLLKKNTPQIPAYSYDNAADVQKLKKVLACGEQREIQQGMDVIIQCIAEAVCTKNSNWDEEEYQKGVVVPYRQIKVLKEEIEKANRQPTIEEVRAALEMLKSVFRTKKVAHDEQVVRFNDIFETTHSKGIFTDFQY